ncbi:MAG: hypothetical protein MUE58_10555, partial [Chitinophagaceae bacterium]|nr:hypothetical protein [Chitinophagaceae bacterium]
MDQPSHLAAGHLGANQYGARSFLGTAPDRPYNKIFLPANWRGWWDYGTGALGDMGCHFMDVPFRALRLGYPTAVECSVGSVYTGFFQEAYYPDSCPPS